MSEKRRGPQRQAHRRSVAPRSGLKAVTDELAVVANIALAWRSGSCPLGVPGARRMMAGGDVDVWPISLRDLQRRRRRCAIAMLATARARAHDPSPLLPDEPTAHFDYLQVDAVPQSGPTHRPYPAVFTTAAPRHTGPSRCALPPPVGRSVAPERRPLPASCRDGCHSPGRAVLRGRLPLFASFSWWVSSTSV
jgi:hypothetical protein